MDDEWIPKSIAETLAANKLINEDFAKQFAATVKNQLSERELRPKELTELANEMLNNISSILASSEVDKK